jgi:hypothetical protein
MKRPLSPLRAVPLLALIALPFAYSLYFDQHSIQTEGTITVKRESIRFSDDYWSRRLDIGARYPVPGEQFASYAGADVSTAMFDRLRVGDRIGVRYLPSRFLRQFPLIPSSRLEGSSMFPFLADLSRRALYGIGLAVGTGLLLVLWLKFGVAAAGWLSLPVGAALLLYIAVPLREPAPEGPSRTALARVNSLRDVTTVLATRRSRGFPAAKPYTIVDLLFVPAGRSDLVHAVDKVDRGSIAGLARGTVLEVVYQDDNPRIARASGGTRTFPEKNLMGIGAGAGILVLLIAMLLVVSNWFGNQWRRGRQRVLDAMAERAKNLPRYPGDHGSWPKS